MNKEENDIFQCAKSISVCIISALLYAFALNCFAVPAEVYCGGLLGMCQVIRTVFVEGAGLHLNVDIASVIYYLLNIPILLYAWFRISREFLAKTVITLSFMTIFLAVFPVKSFLPDDRLAACIVSGLLSGAGIGLILRMGSSAGGFDVIGILLAKKKADMSVGQVSLWLNCALFLICGLLFNIETMIYSMIYTAVFSISLDKVHSQNIVVEAKIITKSKEGIERDIMSQLQRGITRWNCVGSYTENESYMLCVLLSKYELSQLYSIVKRYDPGAFLILNESVHVRGNFLKKL